MSDKNDLDFDDLDDLDFDIPDISIDGESDDRKPIRKLTGSFLSGVKSELADKGDLARKLRRTLPEEYGDGINLADDVLSTASGLYDTVRRESASGIKDFKRASRGILGKHGDKLPEKLRRKLDSLMEDTDGEDYSLPTKEQVREAGIESKLSEIFGAQMDVQEELSQREQKRDTLKETLANKRHEGQIEQLFGIRQEIHRQVKYQDEVTARWQKKSLELQYRHLYVSQDILSVNEKGTADIKIALQTIAKNTSLPEYRKIELGEAGGQALRERMIRGIQNSFLQYASGFWARSKKNLQGAVQQRVGQFNQAASGLAGIAATASDIPIDPYEAGGSTLGAMGANVAFDRVAPHVRKLLEKNPELVRGGQKVARTTRDLPRMINEWAGEDAGYGMFSGVKRFFQEVVGVQGLDSILETNRIEDSEKSAFFDKLTRRSIVEIIPGYLSRIHHEIYALRTGDDDPKKRISFNLTKGSFEGAGKVGESVKSNIFRESDFTATSERLNKLYDIVDPEGKLSDSAREALGTQLLQDTFSGLQFKAERYAQEGYYKEDISTSVAKELSKHFTERFGVTSEVDENWNTVYKKAEGKEVDSDLNQLSDNFSGLLRDTNDPIHQIQGYLQTGHRDILLDLGLIYHKDNRDYVDYDKVWKLYTKDGFKKLDERISRSSSTSFDPSSFVGPMPQDSKASQHFNKGTKFVAGQYKKVDAFGRSTFDNRHELLKKGKDFITDARSNIGSRVSDLTANLPYQEERDEGIKRLRDIKDKATGLGSKEKARVSELLSKLPYQEEREELGKKLQTLKPKDKTPVKDFVGPIQQKNIIEKLEDIKDTIKERSGKTITSLKDQEITQTDAKRAVQDGASKVGATLSKWGAQAKKASEDATQEINERVRRRYGRDWSDILSSGRDRAGKLLASGRDYGSGVFSRVSSSFTNGSLDGEAIKSGKERLVDKLKQGQELLNETLLSVKERLGGKKGEPSEDTKTLVEAIERHSSVDIESNPQVAILSRILENVEAISLMMAKGDKESMSGLKGIGKRSLKLLGKVGGGFASYYAGALRMMGGGLTGIGSMFRGGGRMGGNILGRLFSRGSSKDSLEAQDIYIKGTEEPVLTTKDMEAGNYFDSISGKLITSLKDLAKLKGDVLDSEGNLVVTARELSRGIFNRFGDKINLTGASGILKTGFNKLMGFYGAMFKPLGMAKDLAGSLMDKAKGMINKVQDVYVKGEDTPRLLAIVLKNGGYISSVTGRPIYNVKEVNGDILDRAGNIVLSLNDMRAGLVDKNGRPLGFLDRQLSRLKSLAKLPLKAFNFGINKGKELLSGAGRLLGLRKGGSSDTNEILSEKSKIAKSQLQVLREIKNLIKTRLPERNKWDKSGDGFRDGSWQERLKGKKDSAVGGDPTKPGKAASGFGGGIMGTLASLIPGLGKRQNKSEDKDSEDKDSEGGLTDMSLTDAYAAGHATKWLAGKAGGLFKKGVSGPLGKIAGRVGLTALAAKGGAILGGAAAAVGGILTLPVLLTAAAVAAVAVGGYLTYRHFTKAVIETFGKIRMLQYGVNPDNKDRVAKVLYLESLLEDHTTFSNGVVDIDMDSIDPKKMAEGFGINLSDKDHTEAFIEWFINRFVPVYKTHFIAAKNISPSYGIKRIDKQLKPNEKSVFLEAIGNVSAQSANGSPYEVRRSPFEPMASIAVKVEHINAALEQAKEESSKSTDSEEKSIMSKVLGLTPIGLTYKAGKKLAEVKNSRSDDTTAASAVAMAKASATSTGSKEPSSIADAMRQRNRRDRNMHNNILTSVGVTGVTAFSGYQNRNYYDNSFSGGNVIQHPGNGTGGNINDLPLPNGDGSWNAHKNLIVAASAMAGVDPGLMASKAAIESGFRANVKAGTSSATGLFQFISSTWKRMISKYGSKYGISPNTPPSDPRANALMAAEYLKENEKAIGSVVNRPLTDADFYAAHFMGASGAKKLLTADPNDSAVRLFPKEANANKAIFFDNGMPRSVGGVYSELANRIGRFKDTYAAEARTMAGISPQDTSRPTQSASNSTSVYRATEVPRTQSNTIRASFTTPTIDSSVGIKENINRDSTVVVERQNKERVAAQQRDNLEHKRQEFMSSSMGDLVNILNKSLETQRSMDNSLRDVVGILKEAKGNNKEKEQQPNIQDEYPTFRPASNPDSGDLSKSVIDLRRRRSI